MGVVLMKTVFLKNQYQPGIEPVIFKKQTYCIITLFYSAAKKEKFPELVIHGLIISIVTLVRISLSYHYYVHTSKGTGRTEGLKL